MKALGCELEAIVGRYRSEVRRRAERLIPILMRPYHVYGDWNDLRFEWEPLLDEIKDSPSLAKRAAADIKRAYKGARFRAELHGECG